MARSSESTLNTFACPFADRCGCRVKFRQDRVSKFLSIQQTSALEQTLLLHSASGINSRWPLLAGFDSTFGITSRKFELIEFFTVCGLLNMYSISESVCMTAPLAKSAQGESGVPANLIRTAWVQFLPPPARSMLSAFHQAVCLPLLRFQ